ncbi:hypothetical protein ACHAXR_007396 [Thalassiosira sp. AJA248-18]
MMNNRAGQLNMENISGVFLQQDLDSGLVALPNNIDNEASQKIRDNSRTSYKTAVHGSSMSWVPSTHKVEIKNRLGKTAKEHDIIQRLEKLFDGEISTWSPEAQRIMIACSLFGYGCSDEATIMIMAGTMKALFYELGIDISDQQIAKAFPSRATLSEMEIRGAADSLLAVCQEIKEDMMVTLGRALSLTTDHGHRKGQDHFVKLISWAGLDEEDMWTVKFFCVDIDSSEHTADGAATAIKVSTEQLLEILNEMIDGDEVKITSLTGDSGGGAAAQNLHPRLVLNGTMPKDSRFVNCDMHGIMKPLEIACVDTFGKQGIGHRTPFQMIWLFVRILKKVKKEYGRPGLNEMWAKVIQKLRTDTRYQKVALEKCKHSYEEFMSVLQSMEEGTDEDLDAAIKMSTEAPANIQDPVFSRWGTILAAVEVFVNNWVVIYFFGKSLKGYCTSGSHLWQLSCALLSLMNNKSEPTMDGESLEQFIGSFNADGSEDYDSDEKDGELKLEQGETPIFEAVLYFLDGFNKAYFQDMYHFLMRDDPLMGKNTFGQLSRFGPERCYVMHKKLTELEGDGWKSKPEFKKFIAVLDGIGEGECGIEYFKKATTVFFERFRFVFEKHMVQKWLSEPLAVYALAGEAHHARCFANWLVVYKEHISDQDENDEDATAFEYSFPNKEVSLGDHHKMSNEEPIVVNLRDSMAYITSELDRDKILQDPFIVKNWDLIKELSEAPEVVHLFERTSDGKIDQSTWGGDNYEPLIWSIFTDIFPHSNHQQRCENYVQLTGLLSKTGVAEVRRSCRAIMIGAIIRRFNRWALDKKNKAQAKAGKDKVDRLQGSDKTALFLTFISDFFKGTDKAREVINDEKYKAICDRLRDANKKAGANERRKKLALFEQSLNKDFTTSKAELPTGVQTTAYVAKGVFLRILTKKNKMESVVLAEIAARKIKVTKAKLDSLIISEQRRLLRVDEFKERRLTEELKEKDITYIMPVSNEMKKLLEDKIQQKILDKEMGILRLEEN